MKNQSAPTYFVKIYASGPIEIAKQICRAFCMTGLCVTIEPTLFIYTGGEETGYVVGLINYPRFPTEPDQIYGKARELALKLLEGTFQHSVLLLDPINTEWITKREER